MDAPSLGAAHLCLSSPRPRSHFSVQGGFRGLACAHLARLPTPSVPSRCAPTTCPPSRYFTRDTSAQVTSISSSGAWVSAAPLKKETEAQTRESEWALPCPLHLTTFLTLEDSLPQTRQLPRFGRSSLKGLDCEGWGGTQAGPVRCSRLPPSASLTCWAHPGQAELPAAPVWSDKHENTEPSGVPETFLEEVAQELRTG